MYHDGPGTPMDTFQRAPAPYPPYYYTERTTYSSPIDRHYDGMTVKGERYRPKCGPCMWILGILSILFIIALIVCLIIFFTWGPAYTSGGGGPVARSERGGYIFDMQQPEFVLDRLKKADPNMCLLDTAFLAPNPPQLFSEEHIPTARHFDIGKVIKKDENGQGFVNILNFQNYVRSLGVDKSCNVVVYDHSEAPDSITTATYVWYLFKLHKHDSVSVMNGGLKAWKDITSKEKAVQATSGVPNAKKDGDFEAGWNSKLWLDYESLRGKLNQTSPLQLVDSRKPEYYKGTSTNKEALTGGRIRGALNAPVDEIIWPAPNGALKSLPDVKNWFVAKKLSPNKNTVVYSDSGLQASALYFVMVQAGWDVKLYHNGWIEWSQKAPSELKESG